MVRQPSFFSLSPKQNAAHNELPIISKTVSFPAQKVLSNLLKQIIPEATFKKIGSVSLHNLSLLLKLLR